MVPDTLNLLPLPRQLRQTGGVFAPAAAGKVLLRGGPELDRAGAIVAAALGQTSDAVTREALPAGSSSNVVVQLDPAAAPNAEGYRLTIAPEQVTISAHDPAGAFYAAMTLRQIARQAPTDGLPCLDIEDWPDFPSRGVMLDISRDRVPRMDMLFWLVDMLAEWKVNQFQLYTEHTFAYSNHRKVWEHASPMTAAEIEALDAYCAERFIELVPNQNTFGHFERWLKHEPYDELSICPDGFEVFGRHSPPMTLNPEHPRSIELVGELLAELLPHFSSGQANVGCDETWELGQGRNKALCEERGEGRVYLDFLLQIHEHVRKAGRTMQFWGDIILKHPALIRELPDDIIALDWGYAADHPYTKECPQFSEAGVPFYVCPGTAGWNTFIGQADIAQANIANAAENGLAHGAIGLLTTDWGDNGHHQPPPVSWPGYACGAALSWAYQANRELDLGAALSLHAFHDAKGVAGQALVDLGCVHSEMNWGGHNANWHFHALMRGNKSPATLDGEMIDPARLERMDVRLAAAVEALGSAAIGRNDAALIVDELTNAAEFARHATMMTRACIDAGGKLADVPQTQRQALSKHLRETIEAYRTNWLARSREGGLVDSVARFDERLAEYDA